VQAQSIRTVEAENSIQDFSRWDDVVLLLTRCVDTVTDAWRPARLRVQVEFPGSLHIVRTSATDSSEWINTVRDAFGFPEVVRVGLSVRVDHSDRDGVIVPLDLEEDAFNPRFIYTSRDPANTFHLYGGVSPFFADDNETYWSTRLHEWAISVFARLRRRVWLPRDNHYVYMRAALRFVLPYPLPIHTPIPILIPAPPCRRRQESCLKPNFFL
jgi:hypothetical protein